MGWAQGSSHVILPCTTKLVCVEIKNLNSALDLGALDRFPLHYILQNLKIVDLLW